MNSPLYRTGKLPYSVFGGLQASPSGIFKSSIHYPATPWVSFSVCTMYKIYQLNLNDVVGSYSLRMSFMQHCGSNLAHSCLELF